MLANLGFHPTIAVKDLARARKFYEETLGMRAGQETPEGVIYRNGQNDWFLLYPTEYAGTAQNTVMVWDTPDIETEIAELKSRGVEFEEYDMPGLQTVNGVATNPSGKSAWFKDSEGNVLALDQPNQK
jgi:catechol 2,3-dioxygenase-like lactoylglutathione lyase family enzyme